VCSACVNGYYVKDGNCKRCKDECKTCDSSGTCLTCVNQYYLKATGDC